MKKRQSTGRASLAVLLFALAVVAVGAEEFPRPKGWIGNVDEWAHALAIGFCVLNLILLATTFRSVRRNGLTSAGKQLMFLSVGVVPLALVFFAYSYAIPASEKVEACGACHVMDHWVGDLQNPKSDTLAAVHFKNRYIQENHCYTCHSDYGMFGTISAKMEGLGHILHNTTGHYEKPIKIARPYPNLRCLSCHGASQKFLDPAKHPKEDMADLISGKNACIDCHGPAHAPQEAEKKASR
ncbi:MAG TPA: NapC/NirT family cytochrome c [Thermoanaerobaculia bacterium]|nr:NapC/NirT family cytochrome c [Thermoanaerobaculia bacterium]